MNVWECDVKANMHNTKNEMSWQITFPILAHKQDENDIH